MKNIITPLHKHVRIVASYNWYPTHEVWVLNFVEINDFELRTYLSRLFLTFISRVILLPNSSFIANRKGSTLYFIQTHPQLKHYIFIVYEAHASPTTEQANRFCERNLQQTKVSRVKIVFKYKLEAYELIDISTCAAQLFSP